MTSSVGCRSSTLAACLPAPDFAVAAKVKALLTEGAARAREVATEIASMPSPAETVSVLTDLATRS